MKKLVAAVVLSLMTMSVSFAGENPKLLKEIKRKLTIDFSKVDLDDNQENYVVVRFRIINQEVSIIETKGSKELEILMIDELQQMFIKSDSDSNVIHTYKFNFENEL
ncbi:MAG: hypothetical protein ACJASQ_000399 [Crocinitomicaceae bacterium]|jgi:hypothetical protein